MSFAIVLDGRARGGRVSSTKLFKRSANARIHAPKRTFTAIGSMLRSRPPSKRPERLAEQRTPSVLPVRETP